MTAKKSKGDKKVAGGGASGGKKAKPVEMKIEGDFYSLVKGKQLDLRSGRSIFRVASGVPAIAEEWLNTLTAATTTMYQKSPIFAQNSVKVHPLPPHTPTPTPTPTPTRCVIKNRQVGLVNGETTRQLINENSLCANLVKRMCKDLSINNASEWG